MSKDLFEEELAGLAAQVEGALEALLPGECGGEARLAAAMRYAVLGGGKRLRAFILITSANLFGADPACAIRAACALECLHAYSLVHDDLPAMDDDDMRRGRPTVHRAYDEATAILAGDGLLTLGFEILADPATHADAAVRADLVLELARAAGLRGMVGGQMRDLLAESEPPGREATIELQRMKTGALFGFAAEAGAILGRAGGSAREQMVRYGAALGLAFQIADDLLDEEASPEELGKATGKDRERGKATLPALIGRQAARQQLEELVTEARTALAGFGAAARLLEEAAAFAARRRR